MNNRNIVSIQSCSSIGVILTSVLLGLFMNLSCIAVYLFPSIGGGTDSNGVLGMLYIAVVFAIGLSAVFNHTFSISNIGRTTLVPIVGILIFYYYSLSVYPSPRTPFNHFIVFTVVALVLPSIIKVNTRWVLLSVMCSTLPALMQIGTIFFSSTFLYTSDDILSQGYSYAFLTPVVCTIVYIKYFFMYDFGRTRQITRIAIIVNLLFSYFLIKMGSRGPVVALILLIALPYIFNITRDMHGISIKKKKAILFIVLIVVISIYFVQLLMLIQTILAEMGMSLHFIDKFLIRNDAGDISSERGEIFEMAIDGFYKHPLFGNGFDQFMNNTGRGYPHNFITQTLYDGGLYLFSITILPMLICIRKWFRNCKYGQYIIILTLFFASVPGALFSHDMWEIGNLWLFLGACLNYHNFIIDENIVSYE